MAEIESKQLFVDIYLEVGQVQPGEGLVQGSPGHFLYSLT